MMDVECRMWNVECGRRLFIIYIYEIHNLGSVRLMEILQSGIISMNGKTHRNNGQRGFYTITEDSRLTHSHASGACDRVDV